MKKDYGNDRIVPRGGANGKGGIDFLPVSDTINRKINVT